MERLVAFGCSLTFGHGLPDCFSPPADPGDTPSKYAWPSLIANQLNIECINESTCGSSNKRIWHNILNFKFKKDDIVFVHWSYPERSAVLYKDKIDDIGNWTVNQETYYSNFYSEYDSLIMSKLFVSSANKLLKEKGVSSYNLVPEPKFKPILTLDKETVEHIPVYINNHRYRYAMALDRRHPNEECHAEVARLIMQNLSLPNTLTEQEPMTKLARLKRWYLNAY